MKIDSLDLREILDNLRGQLQLEANQGVRKHDWNQAIGALGGMDALERLDQRVKVFLGQLAERQPEPTPFHLSARRKH